MAIASRIGSGHRRATRNHAAAFRFGALRDRNHHESADRLSSQNIELNRDPVALLVA